MAETWTLFGRSLDLGRVFCGTAAECWQFLEAFGRREGHDWGDLECVWSGLTDEPWPWSGSEDLHGIRAAYVRHELPLDNRARWNTLWWSMVPGDVQDYGHVPDTTSPWGVARRRRIRRDLQERNTVRTRAMPWG